VSPSPADRRRIPLTAEERAYLRREVNRLRHEEFARHERERREAARLRRLLEREAARLFDGEEFVVTHRVRSIPCTDPRCGTVLGDDLTEMCPDCRRLASGETGPSATTTTETVETGQLTLDLEEGEAA
jgi:hypothetical protein